MADGVGHEAEVVRTQGVAAVGDREQRVALQDEVRLLERVPVSDDVATGLEFDDRDRQMTGAIVRAEEVRHTDALAGLARVRLGELQGVPSVNTQGSGSSRDLC
ncbi:hypothetical protein PV342_23415 [Streptomyces sp. PA03-3a]|nr:hypothetical protein [Streptomyces sp. PA03-3a]